MSKISPDKLMISSDFYSVQGEGKTTGVPSYFIRLGLCNLTCGMSRAFTMFEVDTYKKKPKTKKFPENPDLFEIVITATPDNTGIGYNTYNAPYRVNMSLNGSTNVSTFQVLVDNNVGVDTVTYNNPTKLELNPGDTAEFVITPMDSSQDVKLIFDSKLV